MENNGEGDARVVRCMTSNDLDNRLNRFILSVIILLILNFNNEDMRILELLRN